MASDGFSVSAVIPAYNEAARIAAAIGCVRAQSEPAAEIVVVDDGSTDATAEIAAAHGARVVRKPNGGLASARNCGLREARAPWVAFLDADDRWWPEKLATFRRAHEAAPEASLIASDYRVVYEGSRALGSALAGIRRLRRVEREPVAAGIVRLERDSLLGALVAGNFLLTSAVAVRREDVERHALYYDETLPSLPEYHVSEDIEWFLRAVQHCDVLLIESILADYNRHSDNMSASPGRLKYGDVKLGERVVAEPARYGGRTAERFRAVRRAHLAESAVLYMRSLDFGRARAVGRQAFRESCSPAAFGLLALATIGDNAIGRYGARAARSLWRSRKVRLRSVRPS